MTKKATTSEQVLSIAEILQKAHSEGGGSLRKLHDYYLTIIMCMPGNVYWLDADCLTAGCNRNVLKMFGMTNPESFCGLSFDDMARIGNWDSAQGKSFERDTRKVLETGVAKRNVEEPPIPGAEGRDIYFLTTREPIFDDRRRVIGVVGISVDITERKEAEKRILEAKEEAERANAAKDRFIMNMEHDFRTPFNGICGLASLLLEQEEDPSKKETLGMIVDSSKELLSYCASILDYSRMEQGLLPVYEKKFRFKQMLERVIMTERPAAAHRRLALVLDWDERLPPVVLGDNYRLSRILVNLVSNAIKFTHEGHVHLVVKQLKRKSDREVLVSFVVEDTGAGIPDHQKAYIFEKFSRLKPSSEGTHRGLGLGLRIVKQFTHDMGGEIEVCNRQPAGTVFRLVCAFNVPLIDDEPEDWYKNGAWRDAGR